jgi:hypothetical protein
MIWVQHDFYQNFVSSVDSSDVDLSLDIFRSEISDLLTYKNKPLYDLLDKLKIKYSKKSSYEELLDIVIREIKINDKFVRGISFLIGEANDVINKNKDVKWDKLLNRITSGIKNISRYFMDNPAKELRFKRQVLDMIGLKSSVSGDSSRDLRKRDNTLLWIAGIVIVGTAAYLIWRHYDKIRQEKMRLESLNVPTMGGGGDVNASAVSQSTDPQAVATNAAAAPPLPVAPPAPIDPAYTVPNDVLIPESQMPNAQNAGNVQINVQPLQQTPISAQV